MNLNTHHKKSRVDPSSTEQEEESLIFLKLSYLEVFVDRRLKIQVLFKKSHMRKLFWNNVFHRIQADVS